METKEEVTLSGALNYELTWSDKLSLAVFGIFDGLMNCSLESFQAIFSRELRSGVANPAAAPPDNPELGRLRALRSQLDRTAAKGEESGTSEIAVNRSVPLSARLRAKARRQAVYCWRQPAEPTRKA